MESLEVGSGRPRQEVLVAGEDGQGLAGFFGL